MHGHVQSTYFEGVWQMFKLHVANYSLRGMSNLNFSNNEMAALLCVRDITMIMQQQ